MFGKGESFFFFFLNFFYGFSQCIYHQNFQSETNHCLWRVSPSGINHKPRSFFQSAGTQTRTGENTQSNLGQILWNQVPNHFWERRKFSILCMKMKNEITVCKVTKILRCIWSTYCSAVCANTRDDKHQEEGYHNFQK